MKKYKIAIVVDRYWPCRGGVEQAALSLSSFLPDTYAVSIISHSPSKMSGLYGTFASRTTYPENDPFKRPIEALDAGAFGWISLLPLLVWNVPFIRKKRPGPLYDWLYYWYKRAFSVRLEKLLEDIDTVHCISTGYLARCVTDVCLKKGIRFVHEPFIHFGRWGDSEAQLRAYSAADTIICPTESFRIKLEEKYDTGVTLSVKVIPPIIIRPEYPKLKLPPVPGRFILFLGRRETHKGLAELLVAFNGLEHIASLVVAGPGEKIRIRNMAVFDLGEVDEKIKQWLLASCDLFCVPSSDESFGIVYAEAMSFGKPIVAFDVEPINEIVKNGENGILVAPDDTESLHKALELLLTDDAIANQYGKESKKRFDRFYSSDSIAGEMIALHESLRGKPVYDRE